MMMMMMMMMIFYWKKNSLYYRKLENYYEKIINDVMPNGEKTYNDINNQLDEVNKGIEIYEEKKRIL